MGETKKISLMGTTGTGKSTLGNALLGLDAGCGSTQGFKSSAAAQSCTTHVTGLDGFFLGNRSRPVRVIDTPGHGDGAGAGQEAQLKRNLVAGMKAERTVNIFVWVKNFEAPKFDAQDADFFNIFSQMFGPAFVDNLVMVFTRYKLSDDAARVRARSGASLERTIEGFRREIGDTEGRIPMIAIDAMHNPDNPAEVRHFRDSCESLWGLIQTYGAQPVEHVEVVKDKIAELLEQVGQLSDQLEQMRQEHVEDRARLQAQLDDALARQRQLEHQLAEANKKPHWAERLFNTVIGTAASILAPSLGMLLGAARGPLSPLFGGRAVGAPTSILRR